MDNSTYIKKVTIDYQDGTQLEIIDSYSINQISWLMSFTSIEEHNEINELLNKESQNEGK